MRWWTILLAIWLIFMGMVQAASLSFQHMTLILGVLAIVAGVLLLVGK